MAGEAKTNAFNIGTATVMIGPMEHVLDLTPEEHSIGLVKNFKVANKMGYTQLTQGLLNTVVDSTATSVETTATMEAYEYTGKNLSYALGLDGSTIVSRTAHALQDAITGDGIVTAFKITSATDISAQFPVGDWIMVQGNVSGVQDRIYMGKITSRAWVNDPYEPTLTVTCSGHKVPVGVNFAVGDRISAVNFVKVGSKTAQPYLGAKVVGVTGNGEPVTIIFPKIRITDGFNLGFDSAAYSNMPFAFTPYDLVSTDALYADHKNSGFAFLLKRE